LLPGQDEQQWTEGKNELLFARQEVSDGGEEQSQNHIENSWRFSNRNRLFLYNSESNGLFQYCSKEVGV
jgi:hypothetical protein